VEIKVTSDDLGDRMKGFEKAGIPDRFPTGLPVMARMDGRSFSSFTRGLTRPYDERLSKVMQKTTEFLVGETNAVMGYCQSDEITLCLYSASPESSIYFDGRVVKLISQLAAITSVHFYDLCQKELPPEYAKKMPSFDARVWTVPSKEEAANTFLWREMDATKNSISMTAQTLFSHNALHGKNGSEKIAMMKEKGFHWEELPAFFRHGTFFQRRVLSSSFSVEELESLPPKHHARLNPQLTFERSVIEKIDMPSFVKVKNRVGCIFDGESPKTE
jgi:tRNA(His) guanylyltransferase